MQEIFKQIEAASKSLEKAEEYQKFDTLFPNQGTVFFGTVFLCQTDYGEEVIIRDESGVPDCPWWNHALTAFKTEFLEERAKLLKINGVVYEIKIEVTVCKEGEHLRKLKIEYQTFHRRCVALRSNDYTLHRRRRKLGSRPS